MQKLFGRKFLICILALAMLFVGGKLLPPEVYSAYSTGVCALITGYITGNALSKHLTKDSPKEAE